MLTGNLLLKRNLLLAFLCVTGFVTTTYAQNFERAGEIVTYRGNKFTYPVKGKADTQIVVDPITSKEIVKVTSKDPIPTKMNGTRIYTTDEVTRKPLPVDETNTLELYIIKSLSADLNKLPNGNYFLYVSDVIVDNKGKIVFYEYDGLTSERNKNKVPPAIKKSLADKIDDVMYKAPLFKPGKVNGYAVIVRTDVMMSNFIISVKNHKATLVRAF